MEPAVVHWSRMEPAVVQITMEDRVHKNGLSKQTCAGLVRAFEEVSAVPECKVIILTGYDSYFCSGGTQESLFELSGRAGKFTDSGVYELPLACEVPVVAAMQGHGIGAGFILGMFADLVVLSRESIYAANFMKFGFTPGFGSTLVLREKLGLALAQEMLSTAGSYRGAELAQRGIPFPVLPRSAVLPHARQLARKLSEKPRRSLVMLKNHMVAQLRAQLPVVTQMELAMHEQTLHRPEVEERIRTLFGK